MFPYTSTGIITAKDTPMGGIGGLSQGGSGGGGGAGSIVGSMTLRGGKGGDGGINGRDRDDGLMGGYCKIFAMAN